MEGNRIVKSIFRKYNNGLFRFLSSRLNSKADIDDVSQEVYLRLIRHPNPTGLKPSVGLLCKIASNILIDRYRLQRRRATDAHVPLVEGTLKAPDPSPEEMLRSKECIALINHSLETLDKKTQKAMILHHIRGLSYSRIGKEMNISKSMVRKHIANGMLQLAKKLKKHI